MDDNQLRSDFEEARTKYQDDSAQNLIGRSQLRAILWDKGGGRCWYCGVAINPFSEFSIDHIVPQERDGGEGYDNLVGCCRSCNYSKRTKTLEEFRSLCERKVDHCEPFTPRQLAYLRTQGMDMPYYVFYFETIGEEMS